MAHTNVSTLSPLRRAAALEEAIFDHCDLNNRGIEGLADLRELRAVSLVGCGLTNEGIAALAESHSLAYVNICENPEVTDASLEPLSRLRALRVVRLLGTGCSRDGVLHLRRALPHCVVVH
jgi:hypothetical protein